MILVIGDCVKINSWLFKKKNLKKNILNVGSGSSVTFKDIALKLINELKFGKVKIIKFPNKLKKGYQSFTKSNLDELRKIGYDKKLISISECIKQFVRDKNQSF